MAARIPDKVSIEGLENKWSQEWRNNNLYAFDRNHSREEIFSVDTPPPTVSGSLHIGHVFSYTHTDAIVRFQRMAGKHPFYPMGWDDNGLPTERRVQNFYGVTCDPTVDYNPSFSPPSEPFDPPKPISRKNFVELCDHLVKEDEEKFEELWRYLGLSVDWAMTYTTVGKISQEISQRAFLKMIQRGEAYNSDAPTMWDVDFKTAVAQAEIEDREKGGKFYKVAFPFLDESTGKASEDYLIIETTRPELIAADVAVCVNPEDDRYKDLIGKKVLTPLFNVPLTIYPHHLADPEKGSGAVMVSTWGDITDVIWWRELDLDVRCVIGRDGRLIEIDGGMTAFGSIDPVSADKSYGSLVGKYPNQARKEVEELLRESGSLLDEPREIMHPVKFYEKGDRPLELVASRQWYIKNGGRDDDIQIAMKHRGNEMVWHPPFMESRYQNWIEGLNGDWLVSRQRYFGVPIPVWFEIDENGDVDYSKVLIPEDSQLPVDPSSDTPPGFSEEQRNKPKGFVADPDIFDTWATSSLTPQIAGQWSIDDDLFNRVFPMDLRPQAHEIIRTWLFSTVLRAHYENDSIPFKHALISGWILDPDRKKMSKSKGNVVTPMALLEQYGSDAVRYWAANGRPGVDTAFDEGIMKIGKRLVTKLLNASRFVLTVADIDSLDINDVTQELDRSYLSRLHNEIKKCTDAFKEYDYARALQYSEENFWDFCDNYLEIVKARAYGSQGEVAQKSAQTALRIALVTYQKLFAPFLPFAAEEAWSWWQDGSVHLSEWPNLENTPEYDDGLIYNTVQSGPIFNMRSIKSKKKISMKTPVIKARIHGGKIGEGTWKAALEDIKDACNISDPTWGIDSVIQDDDITFFVEDEIGFELKDD